jgi:hypothetical protein
MPEYYDSDDIVLNDDEMYEELLRSRGIKAFEHYRSKKFDKINTKNIRSFKYVWSHGDTLHKLAVSFYGNAEFWWIIGFANGKPTDAHYKVGDEILVPINSDELIGE